jgi:hypothetical protein
LVLVIDDAPSSRPAWLGQLEALFTVVQASTLAGAAVAIDKQDVAAVVLVLDGDGQPVRTLVSALRGHRTLERASIFVVAQHSALVAADLFGVPDVDVLEPEIADFDLCLRVGTAASRMWSRPVPKRGSDSLSAPDTRTFESLLPKPQALLSRPPPEALLSRPPPESFLSRPPESDRRLLPPLDPTPLARFCQECVARGERGLLLCELLTRRDAPAGDRARAADELGGLFTASKADATQLALRELAVLFGMAELVVSRLDAGRGQLVVPRGVVGLLAAFRELARPDQLLRFDVELHRTRLSSAIER